MNGSILDAHLRFSLPSFMVFYANYLVVGSCGIDFSQTFLVCCDRLFGVTQPFHCLEEVNDGHGVTDCSSGRWYCYHGSVMFTPSNAARAVTFILYDKVSVLAKEMLDVMDVMG